MTIPLMIKASVSAEIHRGVIRKKSGWVEGFLMKGCVATTFLFVSLLIFGLV